MEYLKYNYIYPPRPKNPIPPSELDYYDGRNRFIAQPKLNGSNLSIYTNGGRKMYLQNRHDQPMSSVMITQEIKELYRGDGGWMILNGEYLNKNQKNSFGTFNHKFVLFDILAYDGDHLVGKTFEERINLIYELYGEETFSNDNNLNQISENTFSVKSFYKDFHRKYKEITSIPVYEGLVLKRKNSKLENGLSEMNNVRSQIKCRKETRNYRF